jgi:hypothetical protein
MLLLYTAFGCAWAWLCYKHQYDLLPLQVRTLSAFYHVGYSVHLAVMLVLPFKSGRVTSHRNGGKLGLI